MKRFALLCSVVILAAVFLSACWSALPFGSEEARLQGKVRVLMTDAPASEVAEAWVTITHISLIREDGHVTTLSDEAREFDLLKLRDGATLELAYVSVDQGTYNELRFVVAEEAHVVFNDGSTMTLKVPSGTSSGIKVKFPPFTLATETDEIAMTTDFDFERSFHRAGNKYILRPVMRPESMTVNGQEVVLPEDEE